LFARNATQRGQAIKSIRIEIPKKAAAAPPNMILMQTDITADSPNLPRNHINTAQPVAAIATASMKLKNEAILTNAGPRLSIPHSRWRGLDVNQAQVCGLPATVSD